jgi:hypothetical protein
MVSVEVPTVALRLTVILIVEVPEPVTLDGVNVALTRFGRPVTLRVTVPVNPFTAVMVTV